MDFVVKALLNYLVEISVNRSLLWVLKVHGQFTVLMNHLCDSQPGMHVNGAPQMMQPPQMGGGGPGTMPGQGPMGPAGKLSCLYTASVKVYLCP